MSPSVNAFLLALGAVLLGLIGILLMIALVSLIIILVLTLVPAIRNEWRKSRE